MRSGKIALTVFIFVLVVCAGGAVVFAAKQGKTEKLPLGYAEGATNPSSTSDIKSLSKARPERANLDAVLRLTGTLVADEKSDVASTANGIVSKVNVERGSLVEKGDILVTVDPIDAQNLLDEGRAGIEELRAALGWDEKKGPFRVEDQPGVKTARSALTLAESNFKRYSELYAQKAVPKLALDQYSTEFETAQQRYEQAQHQAKQLYQSYRTALTRLETLKKMVSDTTITAPFSGWISEKYVSEGERVTTNPMGAGAKIATLMKIDPIRLVVAVPQQHASLITQGQQIKFTVDAYPDKAFTAEVRFIGPSLESNSRALTIEAIVANPDKILRPGFFASAELVLPVKQELLTIPASAVLKKGEVSIVNVQRENKVVTLVVAVDEIREARAYIRSGLTQEDEVIINPEAIVTPSEHKKPEGAK